MDPMMTVLRRVRRRLGVQRWIHFSIIALLVSLSMGIVVLLMDKALPLPFAPAPILGVLIAVGFVVATCLAVYRRPTTVEAALEADRRLGLAERLTSSLALAGTEGPMIEALHADARRRIEGLDVMKAFPLTPPRSTRWVIVPLAAVVLATFVPEIDPFGARARMVEAKARAEVRKDAAKRLEAVARPLKNENGKAEPGTMADVAATLERMAEDLKSGKLTEKEALAKLSDLGEDLKSRREQLEKAADVPTLPESMADYGPAATLAKNLKTGNFEAAASEMRKLREKLEKGELNQDEKKKLAEAMEQLSKGLEEKKPGQNPGLSKALAKAAAGLKGGESAEGLKEALEGLEAMELSAEDVASALEQMKKLDAARKSMAQWQQSMLGPSPFCRMCGQKLGACKKGGDCKGCGAGTACTGLCSACSAGSRPGQGLGMRGPGQGEGNTTGPLPDVNTAFQPTLLPGQMTPGKVLADIMQRTSPDPNDAKPTAQYIEGAMLQVEQQAEQALTKEEIPAGSKEFVRRYFGSLEPEGDKGTEDQGHDDDHAGHSHQQ